MALGSLRDEQDLENWTRQLLDRLGVHRPPSGTRPLESGVVSVTFAAANFSNIVTVGHTLGVVPDVVAIAQSIGQNAIYVQTGNLTATSFDLQGCSPFALATQTTPLYWIARG